MDRFELAAINTAAALMAAGYTVAYATKNGLQVAADLERAFAERDLAKQQEWGKRPALLQPQAG